MAVAKGYAPLATARATKVLYGWRLQFLNMAVNNLIFFNVKRESFLETFFILKEGFCLQSIESIKVSARFELHA